MEQFHGENTEEQGITLLMRVFRYLDQNELHNIGTVNSPLCMK